MGTDARVRYTKMVLKEALFKCLKEKSIKDITITEVCELAEVNRATFCKHYNVSIITAVMEMVTEEAEKLPFWESLSKKENIAGIWIGG